MTDPHAETLFVTDAGDTLSRQGTTAVLRFGGRRTVLSTSPCRGGLTRTLTGAFNVDCSGRPDLTAANYPAFLRHTASELGFRPGEATGLGTTASMKCLSVKSMRSGPLTVTAAATAGVEVNAVRAGDPASYEENNGNFLPPFRGTVNILLLIGAALPECALPRALITLTEAKSAALADLMTSSRYSSGLATGSGTDGAVIASRPDSPLRLGDAGTHSRLGELTALCVMAAVKESLKLQTGLCPRKQHSVFRRTERFGVSADTVWEYIRTRSLCAEKDSRRVIASLRALDADGRIVALTAEYVHMLDELGSGLLSEDEVRSALAPIISRMLGLWLVPGIRPTENPGPDELCRIFASMALTAAAAAGAESGR
jgi:adenosylcobinamide hydrolase